MVQVKSRLDAVLIRQDELDGERGKERQLDRMPERELDRETEIEVERETERELGREPESTDCGKGLQRVERRCGQDQGDAGGEEVGGVGGEQEEELAPAPQPQSKPVLTEEAAIQKETEVEPPTPRPRTKRPSLNLSLTGSEDNTATTENGEEPFKVVAKKKRFQQKAAEMPDGRAQPVQNAEPVQTGRLRAPDGESVPPNAEEENTAEVPRSFLVTVQTENGKVEVEEFGETVLSCKYQVEKDPNPRVEWKKIRNQDVSFVYYEGKIVGGFQGRAVMEGASIRIKKAMLLDSGEYRCEVSARQDSRPLGEATVSLTVLVPPDVPSCGIPSSVLTGTVVELTCRDRQGTPPSLYRWYKNGIALPNTPAQDPLFANSSYTLNSSSGTLAPVSPAACLEGSEKRKLDSGEYRCEVSARQDSRPLGEATVSLTVLVPPDVPSCGIPSSVLTGTVVELTCRDRQGTPPSLYRWYKNGIALPNTPAQDPVFANSSYTLNSSSGTLQFNTVSKGDAGQYQCEASNGVGEPQRCAAKFMQIDDMNVSGIVAAVVVVSLVVSMCGLGVFFAHRLGYFNSEYTPQFNTVSKVDAGQYQCEASNGVGEPQRCAAKFMQIDDMNVSGIVAAVVVVSLVVSMCGLGVVFAHRHGYFNGQCQTTRLAPLAASSLKPDIKR
ncbi:UNVERIFIED_CONTAM: hypothetical protein FKN15_009474 [Acipenser sinensis]